MSPLAGPSPAHGARGLLFIRSWDGKVGETSLEVKTRGFPTAPPHCTAIFSLSGRPMEGTKLSVLDKLPCWGRWLGEGEEEEREAKDSSREKEEEEGRSLPLAPGL